MGDGRKQYYVADSLGNWQKPVVANRNLWAGRNLWELAKTGGNWQKPVGTDRNLWKLAKP